MIAVLECQCGNIDEYFFNANDNPKVASCHACGTPVDARKSRRYDMEGLQIVGETCPGGVNYSGYYDEGMDEYVTSKQHRAELMKRKGLVEYSPDPEMKKYRDEARYIMENSRPSDAEAVAAVKQTRKTATKVRMEKNVKRSMENDLKNI